MITIATGTYQKKPLGLVLFDGPSQLDGQPIVAIATGVSRPLTNAKTVDMIQTWILRSDVHRVFVGCLFFLAASVRRFLSLRQGRHSG